ncbi:MAG: YihY/virulence factor BrkB family protein [Sphingobacteriaceae bacterium]|nr:MAG: YihY/virulence factor BrkB family protein [Sphingobacteriaceae bacterium]
MIKDYFSKKGLKNGFKILKAAFNGFMDDRALKLSASLAYYTIFSLGPLLLLLISLAGVFFGQEAIQGKVFKEINGMVGNDAALQIQDIIKNLRLSGKSTISVIIGAVTLIIGATTVFGEIQDSINMIWKVKAKPKKGWVKLIKDRLLSSSLIITLGFLLLVSLVINGALMALSDRLKTYLPDITVLLFNAINIVISFIVISVLFGVIFKVLPDAKIAWKDVRSGAIFTAILFMIGRLVIGIYIESSGTSSTYGAAGSLIVILLWVYYTAAILYFGAEFTRAYADYKGVKIEPAEFAVYVEVKELEKDLKVIPKEHNIKPTK